ncbi:MULTISPECIES: hypothetical protein [Leuconostoc]|nr:MULTISPECIES: hypothetical protein [Leuconostoc]MBE4728296.1 hypothetical protein [Leuconostoc suionicum]MDI6551142.1 hypothetical protein [Leuconostoc suionicum]
MTYAFSSLAKNDAKINDNDYALKLLAKFFFEENNTNISTNREIKL